jgi:hypothetical protein
MWPRASSALAPDAPLPYAACRTAPTIGARRSLTAYRGTSPNFGVDHGPEGADCQQALISAWGAGGRRFKSSRPDQWANGRSANNSSRQ